MSAVTIAENRRAAMAAEPRHPSPVTRDPVDAERRRLAEGRVWSRWGPYLADRQWGTVREDYSAHGNAWEDFPHDHARSRAYRWGEDGLLGISDVQDDLNFALVLWNGQDAILKERLFGLTGNEGNHGEDVKEHYWFLDATPTHSYLKALYRYPQRAYPYAELVAENRRRGRGEPEYELLDTGIFAEDRFFDVVVEYAKAAPDDILIRIAVTNHGPDPAALDLLPTAWLRNSWSWGGDGRRPELRREGAQGAEGAEETDAWWVRGMPHELDEVWLAGQGAPDMLFTENETNVERLWGGRNRTPYVKDGINEAVVNGRSEAVNPAGVGTKVAARYRLEIASGATETVLLRLAKQRQADPFADAETVFAQRIAEADAFYAPLAEGLTEDERLVQRQAFAGLIWTKQLYRYEIKPWLQGDPAGPPPPESREHGRNSDWGHLRNGDVISMPDKWEYPWFAAWDLAFHCIPFAHIDPRFAKRQLLLLTREWYMHPNGQLPAYEWAFGDVNPPVHAWSALRVYEIEKARTGKGDRHFLEAVFHKLLFNFTWWVNRKDADGHNIFQGGFLGLDNIGVFDRTAALPTRGHLEQADGTAWMAMYSLNLLGIALELARENQVYEDVATKFFEHFMHIAGAVNNIGSEGVSLWDDEDGFFYDVLHTPDDRVVPLKVRSLVGLIPLQAVLTLDPDLLDRLPNFTRRLRWFIDHEPELAALVPCWHERGMGETRLLSLVRGHRLKQLLHRMLDGAEFLSDYGIRAVSRHHHEQPYMIDVHGMTHEVRYEPAESSTGLFGGNSNWRGPIWFPINYLLVESLRGFHRYYGDDFLVEHPTGSGRHKTLAEIADDLSRRLAAIFLQGEDGRRPVYERHPETVQDDPRWRDNVLFYEYFHGDTGAGVGASHQTGWTALVAALLAEQASERRP